MVVTSPISKDMNSPADRHAHVPAENLLGPGEESSGATPAPATCDPAEGTFVFTRSKSDSELMDSDDTVPVRNVLGLYKRFHESTRYIRVRAKLEDLLVPRDSIQFGAERDIRVRAKLEDWLVPRDSIQFGAELGRGSGGIVYLARWRGLQCAAKTLYYEAWVSRQYDRTCAAAESNSRKDLMNELMVLSRLRHPNLVLFLGACFGGDELIVLSEFIENGNFEQYVESCKGTVLCPSPLPSEVGGLTGLPPWSGINGAPHWSIRLTLNLGKQASTLNKPPR